jgi:hypothetical protein
MGLMPVAIVSLPKHYRGVHTDITFCSSSLHGSDACCLLNSFLADYCGVHSDITFTVTQALLQLTTTKLCKKMLKGKCSGTVGMAHELIFLQFLFG